MSDATFARRVDALGQFRVADPFQPSLDRDADHHLRRVLRARKGEEIVVTDGRGSWAFCEVRESGIERTGDVIFDPPLPETALYLALLKGDRDDWAVAKATELGVARVVPLLSSRVVVRHGAEALAKHVARWRRVALEAAGQCRRAYDLVVAEPVYPDEVPAEVAVAEIGASGDWRGVRGVAVGPEGGWAPEEWDEGRRRVGLGPSVLRAETAGVVASALLAFQRGGWGFTLDGESYEQ